jgi:hypothetical protein
MLRSSHYSTRLIWPTVLDDNTYTNKTWAEVSGISVREIHVMEVEFLSHMKYNLYTSKENWSKWHATLKKYWTCLDNLQRQRTEAARRQSTLSFQLPSPPASDILTPLYRNPSSQGSTFSASTRPSLAYSIPPIMPSQAGIATALGPERKRSWEESMAEPPAKRHSAYQVPSSALLPTQYGIPFQIGQPHVGQLSLPMPNLMQQQQEQYQQVPHSQQSFSYLPTPSNTVFAPSGNLPQQPYPPPVSWMQNSMPMPHSGTTTPADLSHLHINTHGMQNVMSRHQTPTSAGLAFSAAPSHVGTPNQHSPSYFLTRRNSPYRPVRHMNTLLVPPPHSSMHHGVQNISQDQMRWQPLGKNVQEERPGRVPYLHREAWPETYQPHFYTAQPEH